METAEKLAKFVAQVGPEIEQFSIENSIDNPDLWYVCITLSALSVFTHKCPESPKGGQARCTPAAGIMPG